MKQVQKDQISQCPNCGQTGQKEKDGLHALHHFSCLCGTSWTATPAPTVENIFWNISINIQADKHQR